MSTMKKRIERPFTVLSADLSMNRPAFALLRCTDCGVELLGKRNIPRSATEHLHGPTLDRLYKTLPG